MEAMKKVEEYYKKYGLMVYKRCSEILKNDDKALDAMQDVFAKIITVSNNINYPSSYLYRTSTHVCLNILRREKNNPLVAIDSLEYAIASDEDLEKNFLVKDKLNSLFHGEKKTSRVIAFMRYVDKMSLEDIAEEMEMSVSGIKKRLRKMKDKLHKMEVENEYK